MKISLIFLFMLGITGTKTLTVKSPAFENGATIPSKYTCEGANVNPAIKIVGLPEKVKSLALIVDDPDAPNGTYDHWVMWNIRVTDEIEEDSSPGTQGKNDKGENKYTGPCPPSGTHRYRFKVYALDIKLDISDDTDKEKLMKAMEGHVMAEGELVGLYKKQD